MRLGPRYAFVIPENLLEECALIWLRAMLLTTKPSHKAARWRQPLEVCCPSRYTPSNYSEDRQSPLAARTSPCEGREAGAGWRPHSCGYPHGLSGCVALPSMVHCGSERPGPASENTMRMRVPIPTLSTRSGGVSLPSGVTIPLHSPLPRSSKSTPTHNCVASSAWKCNALNVSSVVARARTAHSAMIAS